MTAPARIRAPKGDLSVTALYTSQVALWGKLAGAELYDFEDARAVFRVVNAAMGVARLFAPALPSPRPAVLQRQFMLDKLLAESAPRHVLELACGLSRRGAAFSADPEVAYAEVDLPSVIELKRKLLARTAAGSAVLGRPNLRLVGGDALRDRLADFQAPAPRNAVLAEGLLMYLAADGQRAFWSRVHAHLRAAGGGTLLFDLVPAIEQPAPGVIGRMLGRLMRRFTGGRGFVRDERGREAIMAEIRSIGFDAVEIFDSSRVVAAWNLPGADEPTQQVVWRAVVRA